MTEVMNSKATTAAIRLPRHSTIPAGMIAISIAIAAATNAITMSFPLPGLATSWCTTMTSRSGSMPSTKVLGARLVPPTSSVRRVTPSGVSSPKRAGRSRNALGGCSPWTSRRHRAR